MSDRLQEGSSQIRLYLMDANEVEIDRLMEIIADVLVDRGYARDGEVRAVLTAEAWDWPEDDDAFIAEVGASASVLVIPSEHPDHAGESDA